MKSKTWKKVDHSDLGHKVELRRKFLPKDSKVLDLFCGRGNIYERVYKGNVLRYLGVDKNIIHNENLCVKTNNIIFVTKNNINDFNVFDLDDYGSPWKVFYLILRKWIGTKATFFITDGLVLSQKLSNEVNKFVSGTEKIPKKMKIPAINRWYIDIFSTMLLDVQKRYNLKIENAFYFFNEKKTVCYWAINIKKI